MTTREILAANGGTVGEKRPVVLPTMATSTTWSGSFTCRKSATWDRQLYFPSEERRAEDSFALKNPTASAGFEPVNLGTKGQHATSRPPKPLVKCLQYWFKLVPVQCKLPNHAKQMQDMKQQEYHIFLASISP
jgi:hypothetical protein